MRGQWIGRYWGIAEGQMMVNIDEVDDHYECVAYVNPNTSSIPGSVAFLTTQDRSEDQKVDASVNAVDPRTGNQCRWEDIQHLYDDSVSHSNTSQVHLYLDNGKLHLDANTEYGRFTSILEKPTQSDGSRIAGKNFPGRILKISFLPYLHPNSYSEGRKGRGGYVPLFTDEVGIA